MCLSQIIIHFKLIQCLLYVNYISVKMEEEEKKKKNRANPVYEKLY